MGPDLLSGRYELGAPLGSGGMARVHEATDRMLGRRVAVKLLETDAGIPHARERFLNEARLAASLSHPHAVAVYDTGTDRGRAYIVMELVEGQTLAQLLAAKGPLAPERAVAVADPVLAALAAAHARGMVHRDVKPANVLLGRDGSVKLADFGIAKATEGRADLTMTGQVIGTPTYLSPEQASGRPATPASDVYATGVVLYEMLAGRPPFAAENPIATAMAHQRDPVPPLGRQRPGLPPGLVAAVSRALAKDPADRYPDAAAFRSALRDGGGTALLDVAETPTVVHAAPTRVAGGRGPASTSGPATGPPAVPAARGRRPAQRPSRVPAVLGGLGVLALLGTGAALAALSSDDAAGQAASEAPVQMAGEPVDALTGAADLPGFLAALLADPSAAGERGDDLADRLGDVLAASGQDRAEAAADLIERVGDWAAAGDLDPAVAARVTELLAPLVTASEGGAEAPMPAPETRVPATEVPETTAPDTTGPETAPEATVPVVPVPTEVPPVTVPDDDGSAQPDDDEAPEEPEEDEGGTPGGDTPGGDEPDEEPGPPVVPAEVVPPGQQDGGPGGGSGGDADDGAPASGGDG